MSLFKKPSDLKVTPTIKVLIYGQPGIGKSTVALSAPSPVLFDFDGGVQRVNGAFQCPTLQVESWEQVIEAMNEDLSEFKTIVIDTAGKMLDYMGAYIIKKDPKMAQRDGSLSLKGYGARKTMFVNFLKQVSVMGKHIVFVAHEKEDKDGELRFVRPEMGGSSLGDLIKELDLVGYMQAIGNERTIFWNPTEKFYAKNSCNLDAAHKVLNIIDGNGNPTAPNDFMTNVFAIHQSNLQKTANTRKRYDDLLASFGNGISKVSDEKTANEVYAKIEGYEKHVWDSKLQAERILSVKCQSLGLKFNAIDNKYEPAA